MNIHTKGCDCKIELKPEFIFCGFVSEKSLKTNYNLLYVVSLSRYSKSNLCSCEGTRS